MLNSPFLVQCWLAGSVCEHQGRPVWKSWLVAHPFSSVPSLGFTPVGRVRLSVLGWFRVLLTAKGLPWQKYMSERAPSYPCLGPPPNTNERQRDGCSVLLYKWQPYPLSMAAGRVTVSALLAVSIIAGGPPLQTLCGLCLIHPLPSHMGRCPLPHQHSASQVPARHQRSSSGL